MLRPFAHQCYDKRRPDAIISNRFQEGRDVHPPILKVDPEEERRQVERLRAVREKRNAEAVLRSLDLVEDAARSGANLLGPTLQAVKAYASVGEIVKTLKGVFGTYDAG